MIVIILLEDLKYTIYFHIHALVVICNTIYLHFFIFVGMKRALVLPSGRAKLGGAPDVMSRVSAHESHVPVLKVGIER
jgi:hypothetical protein